MTYMGMGFAVNTVAQIEEIVEYWGVVPAQNYLLVERREQAAPADAVRKVSGVPEIGTEYLLAASFAGLIMKRIIPGAFGDAADDYKRVLPRVELSQVRLMHIDGEFRLNFVFEGSAEEYYVRDEQGEFRQFLIANAEHLLDNQLYGMANKHDAPTASTASAEDAAHVVNAADESYRPNRQHTGLITRRQNNARRHHHWLHALFSREYTRGNIAIKVVTASIVVSSYWGVMAIGRHPLDGTVTQIVRNHGRYHHDVEYRVELDNGQKITLENDLNPFLLKFDTGQIQSSIHEGDHYHFDTAGPWSNELGNYNIIRVK